MKQINDLTKCPFCGHKATGSPYICDSDYTEDNKTVDDLWECKKCMLTWTVRMKATSVFFTAPDPDGVRDEIELGEVTHD